MSGKHNTKHYRGQSNYPQRLLDRGLSRTPEMPSLETLRKRQGADKDRFDKVVKPYGKDNNRPKPPSIRGKRDR